ncbi:MAG: sigma-70 family RNA polymerase sigma factor [Saprospiraceae bacterium]|nr:sigma-70 family RNA polymerase sigma factor [Saprospiraceae bacterium]
MKTIASRDTRPAILTDETLISLVLSGQESACTILVKRYERLLHSVLQSYLPDYESRQEVIQDTFLRAFRALPGFRGESKFSTWLCKIARSQAISRLRMKRYAAWSSIEGTLSDWEADLHSNEVLLEKQESSQLLRLAVQQLQPNDAKALELFYFYEQSFEEIGALTGWTVSNIKSRLFRARQRLHASLLKEGLQAEYFA